jgi:hypothetical protein
MALTQKVTQTVTKFKIKKLSYDLTSHAGLAIVGDFFKSIKLNSLIDSAYPVRSGALNSDVLKSYLGLLCLGCKVSSMQTLQTTNNTKTHSGSCCGSFVSNSPLPVADALLTPLIAPLKNGRRYFDPASHQTRLTLVGRQLNLQFIDRLSCHSPV